MKIVNETLSRGRHAVLLLSESKQDEAAIQNIFAVLSRNRVASATLEQSIGDKWRRLRIEELE